MVGEGKPIVAIVGRPNVGKSTLFNRIIGGRQAIALNQPGVSRDRHYGHASWEGRDFALIDTGGFPGEGSGGLEAKIKRQIDLAVQEAEVLLLVLDGRDGLIPLDREIDRKLRASGRRVLRVVNKIDPRPGRKEESDDLRLAEFQPLGGELYPISSEHGHRIGELLDAIVRDLAPSDAEAAETEIRVALIGRPNVGKSSLLNRLLGEERVIVDEVPGTTRDVIDTIFRRDGQKYRILDTAGIRRKGKWSSEVERVSVLKTIQAVERADLCLLLLDVQEEGLLDQDAHVAGYAFEAGRGIIILWNKWDLVAPKRGIERLYEEKVRDRLKFLAHVPVVPISAKTGWGVEKIWGIAPSLYKACGRKVKTHQLNQALEEVVLAQNRPIYKGKEVRFLYATQVGTFPPRFIIFVNEPKGVHFSYERYLTNRFREIFGLDGAPLKLMFRKKG